MLQSTISKIAIIAVPPILVVTAWVTVAVQRGAPEAEAEAPPPALRHDGAFAFPQREASVLYDAPELRVSAWNDAGYLYVQAVLWTDADDTLGETEDGRPLGDWSVLRVDADADQQETPEVDRNYMLNYLPRRPGLYYQVAIGGGRSRHPNNDSLGRGAIRYVDDGAGNVVRVDSFVIPLRELNRLPGQQIRIAYWGHSPEPPMTLNSVGYQHGGTYYSYSLPWSTYHTVTLFDRPRTLDPSLVPDGREDAVEVPQRKPLPAVGTVPPPLQAEDWINVDAPPTLEGLRGKVVLVDFWTSNCGTCVRLIGPLNALHDAYAEDGLEILAITGQSRRWIDQFMQKNPMRYVVGTGSDLKYEYGAPEIPYSYVIGRDGTLRWHGSPGDRQLEDQIIAALAAPTS